MSLARLPPGDQSRVSASTATPLTRPLLTSPGARGKRIWTLNRKKKRNYRPGSWAGHFCALNLSFFICKMGMTVSVLFYGVVVRIC